MKTEEYYRKLAKITLLVLTLISGLAAFLITKLEFDYDFEKFFPQGDPESEFYREFRDIFGSDNDFIIIGLDSEKNIFDSTFLAQVHQLGEQLKEIEYVEEVLTITNAKDLKRAPGIGQLYEVPVVQYSQPHKYENDSLRLLENDLWMGRIVSRDMMSTSIMIQHQDLLAKEKCDVLANDVLALLDQYEFHGEHILGRSVGQGVYIKLIQDELMIFMAIGIVLVILFLWIAFRSFWGIWVPLTVVLLSIIWNLAAVKILGGKIDTTLAILPTIITVVGMSDVVHIVTRYLECLRSGDSKLQAIKTSFREVGIATLLTSLSTAFGFLSLVSSPIMPISTFGIYMAIGVMLAYVLAFTLLPAILMLFHKPNTVRLAKQNFWKDKMQWMDKVTYTQRKLILSSAGILAILCFWGISKIESNNYLLDGLGEDHEMIQELRYFEKKYAGIRPLEIAILFEDIENQLTPKNIADVKKLEDYLINDYGLKGPQSFLMILEKTDEVWTSGKPDFEKSEKRIARAAKLAGARKGLLDRFYNQEKKIGRILGQTDDVGRLYWAEQNEKLDAFIQTELSDANFEVQLTGTARLLDRSNELLSSSLIKGLVLAFLLIGLMFGLIFKSWRMLLISLTANVMPLILIAAIMGWTGIKLNVSIAVIFTIIFGISVDDTIHFLSKFKMELSKGRSIDEAITNTFTTTGKAIIVTTIILIGGFITLVSSTFLGTYYVGLLISLALVFAVVADLFLLPVLLRMFFTKKN